MDMVSPPSMCGAVVHCLPSIYWNSWLGEDIHPYQREASNEMKDLTQRLNIHCKKALAIFPDVSYQTLPVGNNFNYSRPKGEFGKWHLRWGREMANLFYSVDLQSLFGLLCTAVLISWDLATPPHPRIWARMRGPHWSAKIDDISL